jgi:hypothetical protein
MDPFTALGIASSVVQFVDFSINVVSKGNKIYHSGDGSLAENHDLEAVANDLLLLQTKLQQSVRPASSETQLAEDDRALEDLGEAAKALASKLLERLNMAKAQGRFRRWKSLRQALKSVWYKKDIDEMAGRVARMQEQLQTRVLVSLK